jgi:hypothetical protein
MPPVGSGVGYPITYHYDITLIAGLSMVLSRAEYLDGLAAAGFADASVTSTAQAAPGMHSAIIRAVKPDARTR